MRIAVRTRGWVKRQRIEEVVNLLEGEVRSLAQTRPAPDIVLLALTQEVIDRAHSVRVSPHGEAGAKMKNTLFSAHLAFRLVW